jgi:hypothetical protein
MKLYNIIYKLKNDETQGRVSVYSINKQSAIQHIKSIYPDAIVIKITQKKNNENTRKH